jgi:hypothetical protein
VSALAKPALRLDRVPSAALLGVGLAAAAALCAAAIWTPSATAWGWLVGFVFWSSFPIGAIALSLIHQTTGGRWGVAVAPTLRLGGLCALLLPVCFAPLSLGLRSLYPWASPGAEIAPDVARVYLNSPAFMARGLTALFVWAIVGVLLAKGRLGLLGASIALVFHGVAISLVAIDWMLSIDPGFSDSAFAAEIGVQQILVALGAAAAFEPRRAVALAGRDLGGLLLAAALGAFYLGLMTFIVKWYGDQPVDAVWYLARWHSPALVVLAGALVLGALVPIVGCAWGRVRGDPSALRWIGLSTLAGVALHDLWLAGATSLVLASPAALLAIVAMGGVSLGLASRFGGLLARRDTAAEQPS